MRRIKRFDAPRPGFDVAGYLSAAASLCEGRGVTFTELRRSALRLLLEAENPLRAYELVARLETALGRTISAMTVYRLLDFLIAQDLVTRLKSHNAFLPRAWPGSAHFCALYVCERCGASTELEKPGLEKIVGADLAALDFAVNSHVLEVRGVCSRCIATAKDSPRRSGANPPGQKKAFIPE